MQLDLNIKADDLKDGNWVKYHNDIEFKIRHISDSKITSITDSNTKFKRVKAREVEISNDKQITQDMFSYILQDWKGFEDKKNQVVDCNNKNKISFLTTYGSQVPPGLDPNKTPSYSDFIISYARDLNNYIDIVKEEKEAKNS